MHYVILNVDSIDITMILKNTDPYKLKKCTKCRKDIKLQERYFTYPLSLQSFCLSCAIDEIPKTIESLKSDLKKIEDSHR